MPLQIGEISKFIVKRETDISYTINPIDDRETDVFLHFNQSTKKLTPGETIDAFLYYDNKKRLCATMETPFATKSKYGFCEVVNITDSGCFLNINTAKDVLLSKDDLPLTKHGWPQIGDKLPIILKLKKDSFVAKITTKEDLINNKQLEPKTHVDATVTSFSSTGIFAVTDEYQIIYIHKSLMRKKYHIGERINVLITNINKEGMADGSLIEQKEKMINTDSEMILKYLKQFGVLHLGNASTPEEISKVFNLSKSAFKRAVGSLYKERLIEIEDYKITYIGK